MDNELEFGVNPMSSELRMQKKFEDFAYVLDYLPHGKLGTGRGSYRAEPLVQMVGEGYFTLLEATPKSGATFSSHERVYIGKELPRDKINHIIGRVEYNDLTSEAKAELSLILEEIVRGNENRFVEFFNNAQAITPRMHSLELIPGIGKKYTWTILRARERKPFTSFKDIKERTDIPDPIKLIAKRIMKELTEEPKYRIFTRPP